jgi:GNAT superfamily N-acetyltransferase
MPRPAVMDDAPGIVALYHSVWHESHAPFMPRQEIARRTVEFFEDRMTRLLPTTVVEERHGSIAGFAAWSGELLGQIYVAAPDRGSSVATDLMAASENGMVRDGIAVAELHCVVGNHRARRFYERMGWRHAGEGAEKVAGPRGEVEVSFWRMRKPLIRVEAC